MSIRIFLMCVFGLIIGIIDKDLIAGIAKLNPLIIAIVFVVFLHLWRY